MCQRIWTTATELQRVASSRPGLLHSPRMPYGMRLCRRRPFPYFAANEKAHRFATTQIDVRSVTRSPTAPHFLSTSTPYADVQRFAHQDQLTAVGHLSPV